VGARRAAPSEPLAKTPAERERASRLRRERQDALERPQVAEQARSPDARLIGYDLGERDGVGARRRVHGLARAEHGAPDLVGVEHLLRAHGRRPVYDLVSVGIVEREVTREVEDRGADAPVARHLARGAVLVALAEVRVELDALVHDRARLV